jgi:hypothetical protein
VTLPIVNNAAGNVMAYIDFQNVGALPCTMFGHPGVAGLNSAGDQVAQANRYAGGMAPTGVVVGSMQFASAEVTTSDVPLGSDQCPVFRALLVTPPDDLHSVRADVGTQGSAEAINACQGLSVGPVLAGAA